jgi:hypothetical protein
VPTPNEKFHTPNEKFRDARESTGSPTHPDESLSRQELAELVNAWIWERHHKPGDKPVELDRNYIGKLEQGIIRWPGKVYREAFRAVLGVSSDAELGFVNTLSRRSAVKLNTESKVKRQKFVHTLTAGGVVVSGLLLADSDSLAELLAGIGDEPDPPPTRVGANDIAHIREATQVFDSWGNTYGGEVVRKVALAQLRRSSGLLKASCPERLLPELHAALGELAERAGYLAVDASAQEEARQAYGFALACAEHAKDWHLRAKILSSMAEQAVWSGQPDEGLTLADHALVRADRLTPARRALLQTDRALALAAMHRVQETLRAIGTADEHFAQATPGNTPPWMAFYTDAEHAHYTGKPLADLAILGHDPGEATTRLTTAVAGCPEGAVRTRTIGLTSLASLTMAAGDPRQAVTIGNEALDLADDLRSHRSTEKLRELFQHAAAYHHLSEVAELRHRIRTLISTPPRDHPPTLLPDSDSDSAGSTHPRPSPGTNP